MDFSKVSYQQVRDISNQLAQSASSMETLLGEVKDLFAKIGEDGTWSGTAASETKAEFDRLSARFPEFSEAVKDCSDYLEKAVQNFEAADRAVMGN